MIKFRQAATGVAIGALVIGAGAVGVYSVKAIDGSNSGVGSAELTSRPTTSTQDRGVKVTIPPAPSAAAAPVPTVTVTKTPPPTILETPTLTGTVEQGTTSGQGATDTAVQQAPPEEPNPAPEQNGEDSNAQPEKQSEPSANNSENKQEDKAGENKQEDKKQEEGKGQQDEKDD